MLPDLTLVWHAMLAESVNHDVFCRSCEDRPGPRCAEGQRLYDAEQAAWREHKANEYLGVA